jgi:hypothetical protein
MGSRVITPGAISLVQGWSAIAVWFNSLTDKNAIE